MKRFVMALCTLVLVSLACSGLGNPSPTATEAPSRQEAIPLGVVKVLPAADAHPPVAAPGWSQPEPLPGPVNTPGGEDSPFITLEGDEFYFFFTPDVNIPAEKQLADGVTGIWRSSMGANGWQEPQRVRLAPPGEAHLDGCPFVLGKQMIFCTVRQSSNGLRLFEAQWQDGAWGNWQDWSQRFPASYEVGEMHISADGRWLVYGSPRPGGMGGFDLWLAEKVGDTWGEPLNLGAPVNTPGDENRPYLSPDGGVLWYDSSSRSGYPGPAIFRSVRLPDGSWSEPEEIISQFAGEPSLSADGRALYFTHHFFSPDLSQMIEADIYVSHLNEP